MNLFRKGFILLFALLFPVIVFLFLKFFGQNEYKLSIYNSSCSDLIENLLKEPNNNIKLLDVRLRDDNLLIDNYINKLDISNEIKVITLSDQPRNLEWMSIRVDNLLIKNLTKCVENVVFDKSFILLIDTKNNVRGYFNSTDRGEIERLDVEIDILRLEK
tara:strand:- start:7365 stop:7844 length:480 start_codon:yes stop_codon:yes gene_type:complete